MAEQKFEIVVSPQDPPERIDKYLTQKLPAVSRSRVQQLIEEKMVLVDGRPVKPSHTVRPGERVEVTIPEPRKTDLEPQEIPLEILFEDEFLLVLNKPAGLVVHPAFGHNEGTLVNALLYHCRHNLSGIGGELRPGIVHRLDKDTSGLMVVAKDDETHRHLSRQFSERSIQRTYLAVVWGHLRQKQGKVETFYGRSPTNRKKMAVRQEGKLAITTYRVIEEFPLLSLVEVKLGTGRTHQIRVHMAYLGHPVFSDPVYGGRSRKLSTLKSKEKAIAHRYLETLHRQALHAQTIGFVHPKTGEALFFTSPLPEDMERLLRVARESREEENAKSNRSQAAPEERRN